LRNGHTEFICSRSFYDLLNAYAALNFSDANGQ
jgi:hypothetical protein